MHVNMYHYEMTTKRGELLRIFTSFHPPGSCHARTHMREASVSHSSVRDWSKSTCVGQSVYRHSRPRLPTVTLLSCQPHQKPANVAQHQPNARFQRLAWGSPHGQHTTGSGGWPNTASSKDVRACQTTLQGVTPKAAANIIISAHSRSLLFLPVARQRPAMQPFYQRVSRELELFW